MGKRTEGEKGRGEKGRLPSDASHRSPHSPTSFLPLYLSSAVAARSPLGYNPATMDGSRRTIGLVLLGLLAFGLRAWVVFALSTEHTRPLDYEHGRIAENLLAGKGFSIEFLGQQGPTSQQAPFYPLLLAAFYKALGVHSAAAILGVELLQCLAGAALTLAVVWLGWSLLPDQRGIGWIAGFMEAIHPSHLYMVTHLQAAIWAALGLTLLLAIAASPRWKTTWRGAVLAGLVAGALLLVEPILALALPVAAAVFWIAALRAGNGCESSRAVDGGPWMERKTGRKAEGETHQRRIQQNLPFSPLSPSPPLRFLLYCRLRTSSQRPRNSLLPGCADGGRGDARDRPLDGAELAGPRRAGVHQVHLRLCLLARQ